MKVLTTMLVLVLAATSLGTPMISLPARTIADPSGNTLLDVTASATGAFSGVTVYAGWYENRTLDFEYDPGFLALIGIIIPEHPDVSYDNGGGAYNLGLGMFTHDVSFGGTNGSILMTGDILIGHLVVPTAGLARGDYKVYIDGSDSSIASTTDTGAIQDAIGTITVTPEPASLGDRLSKRPKPQFSSVFGVLGGLARCYCAGDRGAEAKTPVSGRCRPV